MKKMVSSFVCQECGYESPAYLGKCPECGVWNSLKEITSTIGRQKTEDRRQKIDIEPKTLDQITSTEKDRITTGFLEMDNVLGGGLVKGSVTLLAGDPGIGKSTLLLQTGLNIAAGSTGRLSHVANDAQRVFKKNSSIDSSSLNESRSPKSKGNSDVKTESTFSSLASEKSSIASIAGSTVLYISGEESEEQIKLRANRITNGRSSQNFLLLSITNTDAIVSVIEKIKPSLVVIDSIQTMESENTSGLAGSVPQVRFAAFSFIRAAKSFNIPIILVGHVTKEGMVAGPMLLSHMVDTVLFLEGEKLTRTRILRCLKNRFGPVDEVGIFEMEGRGMNEIKDTEKLFLSSKKDHTPGSILVAVMEGTRSFLVEIQTLVVFTKLPYPRRVASGIDAKRLELLLAVLQKHCRLPFDSMDVFVNVAGGIKISDPASDLGICLALYSSLKNISLPKTVGIAEVGLLGELRNVSFLDKRIKEAKKLGFDKIISAQSHKNINEVLNYVK